MFDDIIKNNVDSLISKIGPLNSFKIDSLIEIEYLPDYYKNMFFAEREVWIYKEKLKLAGNPSFAFSMDETHSLADYDSFLKGIAKVPYDDFPAFLQSMIQLRFNFLCRPRTTLKYFIFKESMSISFDEFLKYFAFFTDYEYLFQAFYDYIAKQTELGKQSIAVYEFLQLINKFDDSHIFNLDSEAFIDLVSPIFEFFNVGYPNDINLTVNADALALFFDDKNMKYISAVLQKDYKNKSISKTELISLFADALLPKSSSQDDTDFDLPIEATEIAETYDIEIDNDNGQVINPDLEDSPEQIDKIDDFEILDKSKTNSSSILDEEDDLLNDYYINTMPKADESVLVKEISDFMEIDMDSIELDHKKCIDTYKDFPKYEPLGDIELELANYISILNVDLVEEEIDNREDTIETLGDEFIIEDTDAINAIEDENLAAEPYMIEEMETIEANDDSAERKKFAHIFDEASIEEIELTEENPIEDDFADLLNGLDSLPDQELISDDTPAMELSDDDLPAIVNDDICELIDEAELLEETDNDFENEDDFADLLNGLDSLPDQQLISDDTPPMELSDDDLLPNVNDDISELIDEAELLEETDNDIENEDDFSDVFNNLVDLSNEETESLDVSELGIEDENFFTSNLSSEAVSEFNLSLINSMKDYTSNTIAIDKENETDIYFMNVNNK